MSHLTAMNPDSNSSRWELSQKHADYTYLPQQDRAANDGEPQVDRVPMWLFFSGSKRLLCRRPVEVEVSQDGAGVLASCERLHVFASGGSYQEAIDSLHEQVVHFFDEYTALEEDDVIGRAIEIRKLYRDYFEMSK